jgi:FMN phosphatase YigB (HAD superfamily)
MPDPDAFRERLSPFAVSPDDETCLRAHYLGMAELDKTGESDYRQADAAIARFFGVADADVEAAAVAISSVYLDDAFVPIPGVAEQLRRLHDARIGLAVVSNASGEVEARLAEHRICALSGPGVVEVSAIVDSYVVGVEKPGPAIFGFALDALGLGPEECAYLGDSVYFDVNGALSAGIRPVHLTPYSTCDGAEHPHVASLRDFTDEVLR